MFSANDDGPGDAGKVKNLLDLDAGSGGDDFDAKSLWTVNDEEVTQESFEMIKARTMYQMVEEIGAQK